MVIVRNVHFVVFTLILEFVLVGQCFCVTFVFPEIRM